MYGIKTEEYVPSPRPATSDRIVAAHYYAAWKKGAAGLHNGFDDLHAFPERTPLMGYYDEADPEVADWEIKWALEHGVNCFIHCWYRKKENMGQRVTVDALRCGHGLHEALFRARYGDKMKFALMFENSPRWGTADRKDWLEHLMPFWTEEYFTRGNYLIIDNKPVLMIFFQTRLSEVFPDPGQQKRVFDECREFACRHGFSGMSFGLCDFSSPSASAVKAAEDRGYDFRFGYSAGYVPPHDFPDEETILRGQCGRLRDQLSAAPCAFVPTASCFRDSTPRTSPHWMELGYHFDQEKRWYLTPDGFRRVLENMKAQTDALPKDAWARKLFMLDNWNEWDEGHFIAPSHQFGFGYLEAVREVFTRRDNLPDYRLPHDVGLGPYEGEWQIPDFRK